MEINDRVINRDLPLRLSFRLNFIEIRRTQSAIYSAKLSANEKLLQKLHPLTRIEKSTPLYALLPFAF